MAAGGRATAGVRTMAVTGYDPFSAEFQADPFTVYRWMRDEAPVYYNAKWNWWALSRWEDVRAAALDPDTFLSYEGIDLDATATDQGGPGFLPNIDNPRHDQVRGVVQPPMLPRRIAGYEESIRDGRARPRRRLPRPGHGGHRPGAGLADAQRGLLRPPRPAEGARGGPRGPPALDPRAQAPRAGQPEPHAGLPGGDRRHQRLLHQAAQRAPGEPAPGPGHATWSTRQIDGVPFCDAEITPESEIMGLMRVLFLGGVESTAGLTGSAFKLLAEHPDQRRLLLDDPSLIPAAVEEAVRWSTPLQHAGRTTSREVTLHGVTIPAGGRVVLVYGSANRDERQFDDPDDFRHRPAAPSATSASARASTAASGRRSPASSSRSRSRRRCPVLGRVRDRRRGEALHDDAQHVRLEQPPAHVHARGGGRRMTDAARRSRSPPGRVARKTIEADGVVSLDRCAPRTARTCRTGSRARTSTSSSTACRPASTRCAATRPTCPPIASASCATRTAAAGRSYIRDTLAERRQRARSRARATTSGSCRRPGTGSSPAASASRPCSR